MLRMLALIGVLIATGPAFAQQLLVSVGDHRISIDCQGTRGAQPTIVLMAGGGRTAKDWYKVQPAIAREARVCSYDRAGLGASENTATPQSAADWTGFQEDLTKRSSRGVLRVAEQSGHMIQLDQPELVVQAIRDVMRMR